MGDSRKNINFILYCIEVIPFILIMFCVFAESDGLANGVVSAKYFWFYLSMGLTSIVTILLALTRKSPMQMVSSDWLVLLFGTSTLVTTLIFNNQAVSTKLVMLVLLILLYFQFRLLFSQYKKAGSTLCFFLITTGLIESVIGLRQLYGFEASNHGIFRLTGTFFNPGPYAGYLCIVFPLALYQGLLFYNKASRSRILLLKSIQTWRKNKKSGYVRVLRFLGYNLYGYLSIATIIATILVIPAAMSRASWIGLLAGSMFVLFFHYKDKPQIKAFMHQYQKKIVSTSIISVLILTGLLVGMYFLKKDSADGRAFIWKTSIQAISDHPLGVGLGHFGKAYGEAQFNYFEKGLGTETEKHVADAPEYGFNEYLQIGIESGIIALVLFLLVIVLTLRNGLKRKNIGAIGSLIALLGFAMFSYPFSILPILIVLIFLLAWCNTIHFAEKSYPISLRNLRISLVCLLLCAGCLVNRYPTYSAFRNWNQSRQYYNTNIYEDILPNYAKLYPYLNDQISFLFEYAKSLSKTGHYEKSNEVLSKAMQISCDPMLYNICGKNHQAMKEYSLAESAFKKAYHLVPNRIYPLYLLALFYEETGNREKAAQTAQSLLQQKAKIPSIAEKEMRKEMERIINKTEDIKKYRID